VSQLESNPRRIPAEEPTPVERERAGRARLSFSRAETYPEPPLKRPRRIRFAAAGRLGGWAD